MDRASVWAPVPAPSFLRGFLTLSSHNTVGHRAYLLGQKGGGGWWYYFPVAAGVKTLTGTLLLLALAIFSAVLVVFGGGARNALARVLGARREWLVLIVPPLVFFALCLQSRINIGIRHMLPVYPFLFIGVAAVLFGPRRPALPRWISRAAMVCLALVVVESAAAFPRYLGFFNWPSGGRSIGWKYLVDSNLDWGQDMLRLQKYLAARHADNLCLEVFGNLPPEHFGIHAKPVPGSLEEARRQGCLVVMGLTYYYEWQPFDGRFDWLDGVKPAEVVGDSFRVYELNGN